MIDQDRIKEAAATIIKAIGEDPAREGLVDTPGRISRMYKEFFSGIDQNPAEPLDTYFEESHRGIVVLKGLHFFSICEHHFLPFHGSADIGYVPNGRVVGASKLARTLDILARRPQIQERLTDQLAHTIEESIRPDGVIVVLRAEHQCMSLRGVGKLHSQIVTSATLGTLLSDATAKQEFYAMLREK